MEVGAMLIVKNEENRIQHALEPLVGRLPQITVVDTGSTDRTREIVKERFGIEPIKYEVPKGDPFNIVEARNFAIRMMRTEWIMTLDADEVVGEKTVDSLIKLRPPGQQMGYFMSWKDFRGDKPFEDYKLFVFRNDKRMRFLGKAHSVPQSAIRMAGESAAWVDGEVRHYPETNKTQHRNAYRDQLRAGIEQEPTWYRYHWFLGYSLIKDGNPEEGIKFLKEACHARSKMFPVETLNSFMVRTAFESARGNFDGGLHILKRGREFLHEVKDDFEVKVNFRISGWMEQAERQLLANEVATAYEFAY